MNRPWATTKYDAAIIGAGPGGLAAGLVLARNGLRVVVFDQRRLPIDKACGEGVLPQGVRLLEALKVAKHLDPAEVHPFRGIQLHTLRGATVQLPFSAGVGWGVRRRNLSQALLRTASEYPNMDILDETVVREFHSTNDGTEISVRDRTLQTRLLIGADGLNSRVRRWAGLEGESRRSPRLGLRQHFAITPWNDYVEVYCGHGIEAYVTPCGTNVTGIAFLWNHQRQTQTTGMATFLQQFPDLHIRLGNVPVCSASQGRGPFHRVAKERCADGVLLLGDAAGYLDACTGEGISLALAQALSLEQTVIPWLKQHHGKPRREDLLGYEQQYRQITRLYYKATRRLLFLHRHPEFFDRIIRLLRPFPRVLQYFWSA